MSNRTSTTLKVTLPNARRPESHKLTCRTIDQFSREASAIVRDFAERHGVAIQAVDYEVVRGRR